MVLESLEGGVYDFWISLAKQKTVQQLLSDNGMHGVVGI